MCPSQLFLGCYIVRQQGWRGASQPGRKRTTAPALAQPFISQVISSKLLRLPEPQGPQLKNGGDVGEGQMRRCLWSGPRLESTYSHPGMIGECFLDPGAGQNGQTPRLWISQLLRTFSRRRQWHPTPVFLPGESQGRGNLMGSRLWGRKRTIKRELDFDILV